MLAMITQKSVWDKTKEDCIIKEAQQCRKPNAYASMVVLLGLVEVIKRPVYSIYPNTNHNICNIYQQKITPSNCTENKLLYLLWSKDTDLNTKKGVAFKPNHFVPVVQWALNLIYCVCSLILFYHYQLFKETNLFIAFAFLVHFLKTKHFFYILLYLIFSYFTYTFYLFHLTCMHFECIF